MTINKGDVSIDAFVRQATPATNYGGSASLHISNEGGDVRKAYVFKSKQFELGSTIVLGVLRFWLRSLWNGGPHTLTIRRVTSKWKEDEITHNHQPTVDMTESVTVEIPADSPAGTMIEVDVQPLLQTASDTGVYHGLQIAGDNASVETIHSTESASAEFRPELDVDWNLKPGKSVNLKPSGGLSVSLASPVLKWDYVDAPGDYQGQFQVQIDDDAGFAAPLHDSGWVVSEKSAYDLATIPFVIADGATRYWRVRVRDNYGLTSDWSDAVSFRRDVKGVLAITNPPAPAGNTVEETTPPVTHTFTGVQKQVRHILQERDPDATVPVWETIYDTQIRTTASLEWTIPSKDEDGNKLIRSEDLDYRVIARVWDDKSRVATPGDPLYVELIREFTYVRSGVPAPIEDLVVSDGTGDDAPGVVFTWNRDTQPDFFTIKAGGKILEDRIDSDDLIDGGGYRYVFWNLAPQVAHTISIEAVVLDGGKYKHSHPVSVAFTPKPRGVWLIALDYGIRVLITGRAPFGKNIGESGETKMLPGRRSPIRIRDSVRGYEGQIQGDFYAAYGKTGKQWKEAFEEMKGLPLGAKIRLIYSDNNFPVTIGDSSVANAYQGKYNVTVDFWQKAEFPMRLRR